MKKTIVINGPGRAGKGTFIKMVRLLLQTEQIPVYSFSSIFPIKARMIKEGIWDGVSEKTEEVRTKMADIKKDMTENGDQPNEYLVSEIKKIDNGLVFVHIREAENIESFVKKYKNEIDENIFTMHYRREDDALEEFDSGVDLLSDTLRYPNYDFDIINDRLGLAAMVDIVESWLSDFLPETKLSNINLDDLNKSELHVEFNDEDKAGII